jgi:hypothetical protein
MIHSDLMGPFLHPSIRKMRFVLIFVQFEESVSHTPQQSHANTFIITPVQDDDHAHADSSSDESFDSEDSDDSDTESV